MQYLDTQELSPEVLRRELPHAVARGTVIPVLVANPVKNIGIDALIEFFDEFAPGADELPISDRDGNTIEPDPAGPLVGTVFNIKTDPHVGKVCLARIFRGTLSTGAQLTGPESEKTEKIGGLFRVVGSKREPIESAGPGEIVAVSKVEALHWGESFTTAGQTPVLIATPAPPTPMVALAIQPRSRADEQKIGEALHKLEAEDPTFHIEHTTDTHQLVAHGMSELHLQIMEARLKRRFGVEIQTSQPKIAYQETISKPAEGHHRHKKQSGGRGQFGECWLRVKPLAQGTGFEFKDAVVGGSIPRNLIPAVEKGIRELLPRGIVIEAQVVDVEVELYDGKFHAVDSDEASFKMAGARAFRDAFEKAHPVLLEPVMDVEIHVPTTAAGAVFSDLTSHRRGHVLDQGNEADGAITIIKAEVPLSAMQTYYRDLKSQTAGEGFYSMRLKHYAQVPSGEQAKIVAQLKREHAEE
jgi:elongation factor G